MKLVEKIKSINFVGTFESLVDMIKNALKFFSIFSKDPKVMLVVKALDVYDQIKEKKVKDITTEDAIKLAELYDQYKPDKEVVIEKPVVAETPVSANTETTTIDIEEEKNAVRNLDLGNADPHSIIGCYGGATMQTVANLPIDFYVSYNGGITITVPKSADHMNEDGAGHMNERRGIIVMIRDNKILTVSDFNGTQFDNRFADIGANKIMIIHVRRGQMISRTRLTEI